MRMLTWIILAALWTSGGCLNCLNSNGDSVDWFSAYKAPRIPKVKPFNKGTGFFYLDVSNPSWTLSNSPINDSGNAIANTVSQIYAAAKDSTMYILYNDEPPALKAQQNEKGHTKGIVAFDQTSGYWLVHSVPHYPPPTQQQYAWNDGGSRFGQTFLCVTFSYSELGKIAYQLLMNRPLVYDSNIPDGIGADYPLLQKIVKGGKPVGPPWFNVTTLNSALGQQFVSFAKSNDFDDDLYESLVAQSLKTSLKVETWLNGQGTKLPSNCTGQYKVLNIRSVSLSSQANFSETDDHSKWAVSTDDSSTSLRFISYKTHHRGTTSPWVCVCDINRMVSQFKRGGGALCLQHQAVWTAFNSVIAKADSCQ